MKQIFKFNKWLITLKIKYLNLKSLYKNTLVLLKALFIFLDGFMPPHLSEALKNKNFHNVHSLLNKRVKPIPVDIRSKEFKTGLMIACSNKDPKMVEVFLKKGAKLELTDVDDGWTALHLASQSGCHESVKQLIDKGANIEARTNMNETPLHIAAKSNNLEIVKLLIEKQAQIEAKTDKGETVLHLAVKHNNLEVVKLLIEKGANIEANTNKNKTAVYLATTLNHVSIVECLAEKKCQIKKALTLAVEKNFLEITKCFLFHLNKIKGLSEKELNDLLIEAANKDHTKIANELFINGANIMPQRGSIDTSFTYINLLLPLENISLEEKIKLG
jgi:ankyrin repeat protein